MDGNHKLEYNELQVYLFHVHYVCCQLYHSACQPVSQLMNALVELLIAVGGAVFVPLHFCHSATQLTQLSWSEKGIGV